MEIAKHKNFQIIMANSLEVIPWHALEKVDEVVLETPSDLSLVTQDHWWEKICRLLKNHCHHFTTYGKYSQQLHDIIDDIAFDDFPRMDGQTYEDDMDEITKTWEYIASHLVTSAEDDDSKEGIETLIYVALRVYDADEINRTVLFLKDLDDQNKWLIQFESDDWEDARNRILDKFFIYN